MAGRRTATKAAEPAPAVEEVSEEIVADQDGLEVENDESDADVEGTEEIASTEGEEQPAAAPAPQVVDYSTFEAAVKAALESKDESTGVMDEKSISDILKSYRELDNARSKTAARKWTEEQMKDAVNASDINSARALMSLSAQLSSAPAVKGTGTAKKTPADPTKAFVETAVRLRLAMQIHSDSKTDDVKDEWKEQVTEKVASLTDQLDAWATYLDAEDEDAAEPENIDPLVKQAFKTVAGKSAGVTKAKASASTPREGDAPRRKLSVHLAEYFADKPVGHVATVAEIRAFKSDEYGDDAPSPGAVVARLFPTDASGTVKPTTVQGLEGTVDGAGKKAAKKVGDVVA